MKFFILSGYLYAIASALLFGATAPFAKVVLGEEIDPWVLAGLVYLTAGLTFLVIFIARFFLTHFRADFNSSDWKWLIVSIFFGGIVAPVTFFLGLKQISASTASLLLNLESVFTVVLAWFIFKEKSDPKEMIGIFLIILGSFVLTCNTFPDDKNLMATLLVVFGCFFWAIDSNVTQKISRRDPITVITVKCLIAGFINIVLVEILKGPFVLSTSAYLGTTLIGFFCCGLSLLFFILAIRHIGVAKTGAYYALAPFIGVFFSVIFLKEVLSLKIVFAGLLMALGVAFHIWHSFQQRNHKNKKIMG